METFGHILDGFAIALQPQHLFFTFVGALLGTVIGVLPGIGPSATIALLIPVTFGMDPTSALIMLAGVFYGARYGGSTTAILIRTPGEGSSVMTSIDGYQMALNGRAGAALAISAIGSFIAGTIGIVGLTLFALPLTAIALKFGPAEYFTLMMFAMTALSALSGKSLGKGMLATLIGLMIATVGIDLQSGAQRFTLGTLELQDGISIVVVIVGLFAVAEVFRGLEGILTGTAASIIKIKGRLWLTREEWRRSIGPIWRGAAVGFVIGVLPGAGGTISSILSYSFERRVSKNADEFGKGAIEGVAGPESANNADAAGAMVPLLTLGLPGGGSTAVMLGAFIMYGIQPGPFLFSEHPDVVWGLIDSMYIGNIMLLILNLPLIGIFVRLLYIPNGILFPCIVAIAAMGIYTVNGSVLDLYLLLFFGVVGYVFDLFEIPLAPLVLALVLGEPIEQSFRQAMTISDADIGVFFSSEITWAFWFLSAIAVAVPLVGPKLRNWARQQDARS